ncbi:TolC family outer membrane protein [Wenzhouxiangella sp. XN79A]|uniref:TolC family outer membrane protein n=1 Tax=Wenzhouxiangella sp. XN79A TaxID=2724193 RepID=UPI00144ACD02|nr:TolC family outer membrane protein [Wenzhouxiangella sp. XN79A]NKI33563.1 TolC family outer membrane protein [Wenzhouxiangella sp. XN79A]
MQRLLIAAAALALTSPALAVDLLGVYELASTNDPQIQAAERRLEASTYQEAIARASLLPTLSGSVSRTIGNSQPSLDGNDLTDNDIDSEGYGLSLRQSIYDDANFGRLTRARSSIAQADAEFDTAWQDFLLRVAQRYFDMLTSIDGLRFAQAEEKALQRQFEQAEQRFEVGLSAVTDFLEARAAWDAARARVIVAENNLENARELLRELTGTMFDTFRPLADRLPLEPPEPADSSAWVERALANRPELEAARRAVDVVDADLRIARSGHLPSLDLVGSYNRNVNNEFVLRDDFQDEIGTVEFQSDTWQVGLELSIPIFSGFAVQSQTRQARVNREAVSFELDSAQRAAVRETENAYRSVIAGIRQIEALEQALISAESAVEATNAGFEVGTRTIVDVLLAEQRFFQAQRDYSQARHQFIVDSLALKRAAGVLAPEDLETANRLLTGADAG